MRAAPGRGVSEVKHPYGWFKSDPPSEIGFCAMADDPRGLLSHFDALLGTEWLDDNPDHARVRVVMRDELRQPGGLLHGGVMSSLGERVCSRAPPLAGLGGGMMARGP